MSATNEDLPTVHWVSTGVTCAWETASDDEEIAAERLVAGGGRAERRRAYSLAGGQAALVQRRYLDGAPVAVKSYRAEERWRRDREARLLRSCRGCDQVVRLLGVVSLPDGGAGLVLEWANAGTLHGALATGTLSTADKLAVLQDVARAGRFLHAGGVTHGDVTTSNCLLFCRGGRLHAKLADLGSAVEQGDRPPPAAAPGYLAPERLAATGPVTEKIDVYAYGVVLCQALLGRFPFVAVDGTPLPRPATALAVPGLHSDARPATAQLIEATLAYDQHSRPSFSSLLESSLFLN